MYTSDSELYVTKRKLTATTLFSHLTQEDCPMVNIHQSQIQFQLVRHFLAVGSFIKCKLANIRMALVKPRF